MREQDDTRTHLRQLGAAAVLDAHAALQGVKVQPHWSFPTMNVSDFGQSGMPSFHRHAFQKGPPDYTAAVGPPGAFSAVVDENTIPSLVELLSFARSSVIFREAIGLPQAGADPDIAAFVARSLVGSAVERLMHTNTAPTLEGIQQAWEPLERGFFETNLPFDTYVPLLCLDLDVPEDAVELAADVRLVRMDEKTQIARMMTSNELAPVPDVVLGAASHALIVAGGRTTHAGWFGGPDKQYPRERINSALQALRVASDKLFGHAQLIAFPVGWATRWIADLPATAYGVIERRYPPSLDDYGWLRAPVVLGKEHLETARRVLQQMEGASKRMRQSVTRVDRAQMREDPDDAVVDYCIGLESLLDDTTHTETTHKCALRAATVLARSHGFDPDLVFRVVKRAYALRSGIVHGQPEQSLDKLRTLKIRGTDYDTIAAVRTAHHRLVIALLDNETWQDPTNIDTELLRSQTHDADRLQ